MEDIQDGIKVSIQDGKEEDPEEMEELIGMSGLGLVYLVREMGNIQIITEVEVTTDSKDLTSTISTIIGTTVT